MKLECYFSKWGGRVGFGPFIDFQDWNIWHHTFTLGFSFGRWDIGLTFTPWDIEELINRLILRGMTEKEAWDFCDGVRRSLPKPYGGSVNMEKEVEKVLAQRSR